nr:uncharacterized protein LOC117851787 [Setaria viridis]
MDGGGGRPSPDSLFAVLITDCAYQSVIYIFQSSAAAAFRVPGRERISDVALVDGKLYALSPKKLFVLEVDSSRKAGEPKTPSMKPIADAVDTPAPAGILYKTIAVRDEEDRMKHSRTFSFEVYEADLATDSCLQWRRLNSLGGQALFVGPSSKFLQASECGAQPDCIYFICDYDWGHSLAVPLRDCGVFDMRNGTVAPMFAGDYGDAAKRC